MVKINMLPKLNITAQTFLNRTKIPRWAIAFRFYNMMLLSVVKKNVTSVFHPAKMFLANRNWKSKWNQGCLSVNLKIVYLDRHSEVTRLFKCQKGQRTRQNDDIRKTYLNVNVNIFWYLLFQNPVKLQF